MEKVPIRIFSPPPEMALLGEIRDYESLSFTRRFYAPGEFELHINIAKHHTDALVKNNLLVLGKNGAKTGIIRHRENQQQEDSARDDTLIIKGPTLQGLAHDHMVLPDDSPGSGYEAETGQQETIMKYFVNHQMVSPANSDRKTPGLVIAADQGRGAADAWRFGIKDYLDDALNQIGTYALLGWDITADLADKQLVFDVRQGVNRSRSQSAVPPVMFAAEWSNIKAPHFIQSWLNAATVGYAIGPDSLSNLVQEVGSASGFERQEQAFDCSSAETAAQLLTLGSQALGEAEPVLTFDFDILPDQPFQYGTAYDLGDTVTAYSKKYGITMDAQITEVTEIYETSGNTLTATFGTNIPTLAAWLRREIKKAV